MQGVDWRAQIQVEFDKAEKARYHGNEGQARVVRGAWLGSRRCEYFARLGQPVRTPSSYDLLNLLVEDRSLSDDLRQAAKYLTLRVNGDFRMPVDVDLLVIARKLCDGLLNDTA